MRPPYPFSAIVGQDDLRLALLLSAISPEIGGVLIRGEKGTAKSTAVRALAGLLPEIEVVEGCPFSCDPKSPDPNCPSGPHNDGAVAHRPVRLVELPVGATIDRVAGSIDLERALAEGVRAFKPGLLAAANRGILYVDEINLLPDHLVDLLLDAAALGVNHVERESISVRHAARLLLVGTMNPEEGELRPQLLDRFGISVEVRSSRDPQERAEVIRRRLAYERDPERFVSAYQEAEACLALRIVEARRRVARVRIDDEMLDLITSVCVSLGVDGMRGDIACARAAAAHAAWQKRTQVELEDIKKAALLALSHRRRRTPLEAPGLDPKELDRLLGIEDGAAETSTPPEDPPEGPPDPPDGAPDGSPNGPSGRPPEGPPDGPPEGPPEMPSSRKLPRSLRYDPSAPFLPVGLEASGRGSGPWGRRSPSYAPLGRRIDGRPPSGEAKELSLWSSLLEAAPRQLERGRRNGRLILRPSDLSYAPLEGKEGNLILFVVDASGSMAARKRMAAAKGAALSILLDAYRRRDRIGLVAFWGEGAELLVPPTSSVELAASRLSELPAGGRTPLGAGLSLAAEVLVVQAIKDPSLRPLVVAITDGRATSGSPDPLSAALSAAGELRKRKVPVVVIDTEEGPVRLGMAVDLARAAGGISMRLEELAAEPLSRAVRELSDRRMVA